MSGRPDRRGGPRAPDRRRLLGVVPSASPASCYLVEHAGARVVLDLGNEALGPLAAHADLRSLDAVLLSHLHADHCLDLSPT